MNSKKILSASLLTVSVFLAACRKDQQAATDILTDDVPAAAVTDDSVVDVGAMMRQDAPAKGEYKDHRQANLPAATLADGKTKVLFFHASWCPACKQADGELTQWYAGADAEGAHTIYKIDYDTEKDLKAKYGVTYQHTFVKVDGQGNLIEKIQSPAIADIAKLVRS